MQKKNLNEISDFPKILDNGQVTYNLPAIYLKFADDINMILMN